MARRLAILLLGLSLPAAAEAPSRDVARASSASASTESALPAWAAQCRARLERAREEASRAGVRVDGAKVEARRLGAATGEADARGDAASVALILYMGTAEVRTTPYGRPSNWRESVPRASWRSAFRDGDRRAAGLNVAMVERERERLLPILRAALDDCLEAR